METFADMETFVELGGVVHIRHDGETDIPIIELTWGYYDARHHQQPHENISAAILTAITQIKQQMVLYSKDPEVQLTPKGPKYAALLEWAKK